MTSSSVVLKGGRLLDRAGERSGDVVVDVDTGLIRDVGPDLSAEIELDATGCVITPGFVDLHADVAEPGRETAETVLSASAAAVAGGYTAVVAMPYEGGDQVANVVGLRELAQHAFCDVVPAATISVDRDGEVLAPLGEFARAGISMFCDTGIGVQNDLFMRRACEYLQGLVATEGRRLVLAQHCSSAALAAGGVMHEGAVSSRLGLPGQPSEAEELMVMRDITLSRLTGAHVHFQSVSTAGSVAMIRAAKSGGLAVSAEVTAHHLLFTHEACVGFDPVTKLDPPLRTAEDVRALRAGLVDGTIDAIATNHRPHPLDAKERPFDEAPAGAIGLETTFAALHSALVAQPATPSDWSHDSDAGRSYVAVLAEHRLELGQLVALLSWQPAAIAGIEGQHGCSIAPGQPANLTSIDSTLRWTVNRADLQSSAQNTLFHGQTMTGRIRHTVSNGMIALENGQVKR